MFPSKKKKKNTIKAIYWINPVACTYRATWSVLGFRFIHLIENDSTWKRKITTLKYLNELFIIEIRLNYIFSYSN